MLGSLCFACGVAPILGALQIIPYPLTPGTPTWVGIAAGAVFILAWRRHHQRLCLRRRRTLRDARDPGRAPAAECAGVHHSRLVRGHRRLDRVRRRGAQFLILNQSPVLGERGTRKRHRRPRGIWHGRHHVCGDGRRCFVPQLSEAKMMLESTIERPASRRSTA